MGSTCGLDEKREPRGRPPQLMCGGSPAEVCGGMDKPRLKMTYLDSQLEQDEEVIKVDDVAPMMRRTFNFRAHGAIPDSWVAAVESEAPDCFIMLGRDALVISDWCGKQANVLWALPTWAVDERRVKTLISITGSGTTTVARMCRLRDFRNIETTNTAVCQFRHPEGVPLSEVREERSEMGARRICRQVLEVVASAHRMHLCFRGLLLPSLVFVRKHDFSVETVVPIGCLLSWLGFLSSLQELGRLLAPEMLSARDVDRRKYDMDRYLPQDVDVFGTAAMVLQWLIGETPDRLHVQEVADKLSDDAYDFLSRSLQRDPEWRLSIEDALAHRWLNGV